MLKSSESVAALATALAKAQGALTNPEKSLTATIWTTDKRGNTERSFRYAPLASGLDIIRKTLGRHELAVMQTTAIDRVTGTVNLATILAHSSGEWMSSEWPVCPVTDVSAPRRMGAALTYARRYALFTLVGIAGEDDLDAPDLGAVTDSGSNHGDRQNGNARPSDRSPGRPNGPARLAVLAADQSAILHNRLLGELQVVASLDELSAFAQRVLKDKNTLTTEDAALLEAEFAAKRLRLTEAEANMAPLANGPAPDAPQPRPSEHPNEGRMLIGKTQRVRSKPHLRFVSSRPCLICARQPCDAHHLRFVRPRALGRKVSDEFTVPLCRAHHREAHRASDERAWWLTTKIDPLKVARDLWAASRSLEPPEVANRRTKPNNRRDPNALLQRTDANGTGPSHRSDRS